MDQITPTPFRFNLNQQVVHEPTGRTGRIITMSVDRNNIHWTIIQFKNEVGSVIEDQFPASEMIAV